MVRSDFNRKNIRCIGLVLIILTVGCSKKSREQMGTNDSELHETHGRIVAYDPPSASTSLFASDAPARLSIQLENLAVLDPQTKTLTVPREQITVILDDGSLWFGTQNPVNYPKDFMVGRRVDVHRGELLVYLSTENEQTHEQRKYSGTVAKVEMATAKPANERYQIFQSPIAAEYTFRLDKQKGIVSQLSEFPDKRWGWEDMDVSGLVPDATGDSNYELFTSPIAARFTFLISTKTGDTWVLNKKGSDAYVWEPLEMTVEEYVRDANGKLVRKSKTPTFAEWQKQQQAQQPK